MKIIVDGDGCPVINLTISIAKYYGINIVVVKNYCHEIYDDYASVITVDKSPNSADFYIANHAVKNDIVVTQDYGLAAMVIAKGAKCINQNGFVISSQNIDELLERRHFNRELRVKHKKYTKFKKRNHESDKNFEKNLKRLIEHILKY